MNLEVLVATMNQNDFSLVEKMNLQSDAVFANQTSETRFDQTQVFGKKIKMISTLLRGVGKNRNMALSYAEGDILVFSDDDVRFLDGYAEVLTRKFADLKQADIIIFNLTEDSGRKMIRKVHRVKFHNFMRYGAVRIAVRKSSLDKANVYFSMLYGGGATYSSGEDSLFLRECLHKGLNIYAIPDVLAELLNERASTWDTGDKKKQAYDKGFWLKNACPKIAFMLKYIFAYKMKSKEYSFFETLRLIEDGISDFNKAR